MVHLEPRIPFVLLETPTLSCNNFLRTLASLLDTKSSRIVIVICLSIDAIIWRRPIVVNLNAFCLHVEKHNSTDAYNLAYTA